MWHPPGYRSPNSVGPETFPQPSQNTNPYTAPGGQYAYPPASEMPLPPIQNAVRPPYGHNPFAIPSGSSHVQQEMRSPQYAREYSAVPVVGEGHKDILKFRPEEYQHQFAAYPVPLNPSNTSPTVHGERPLSQEEKAAKHQQHLKEYEALFANEGDSNNSELKPAAVPQQNSSAVYPGAYPRPAAPAALRFSQEYPASPQYLPPPVLPPPVLNNRASVGSYLEIVPALSISGYQPPNKSDDKLTEEELVQIRAAEAASLADRTLTGRDICKNSIQSEQQKDYDKIKKIWDDANGKSLIEKFLAILNFYTGGDSLFKPLVNRGRKNLMEVEPIVKHLEEIHKAKIPFGDEELTQQVLEGLYKIPLNNPKGTLATVIQFLTQMNVPQVKENIYQRLSS